MKSVMTLIEKHLSPGKKPATPETELYHGIYDLAEDYSIEVLFEATSQIVIDIIEAERGMREEEKRSFPKEAI